MKRMILTAGAAFLFFAVSCSKNEEDLKPSDQDKFNPTAYQFNYPAWVNAKLGPMPIPSDNPTTEEGVLLGRKLFYDKRLSDNNSISCASCHALENSFTDPRRFSEGSNGAKGDRNSMAIVNMGWSTGMFWDGRRNTLEHQALDPVTNPVEMRNSWPVVVDRLQNDTDYPILFYKAFGTKTIDSLLVAKALSQFERTLVSFNSRYDRYVFENDPNVFNASEKRGHQLFIGKAGCVDCHTDVLFADNTFRNIGLDDPITDNGLGDITNKATDMGKFKVPTLRNIELTAPYMHDGRFPTLEDVIEHYNHGVRISSPNVETTGIYEFDKAGIKFTNQEMNDLKNFLLTLTDHSFIQNPDFQDPN